MFPRVRDPEGDPKIMLSPMTSMCIQSYQLTVRVHLLSVAVFSALVIQVHGRRRAAAGA